MQADLKQQLLSLIDSCNDEFVLAETKSFIEKAISSKDWWNELSEEDKNLVLESEAQYEKGSFLNHQQLMQQFEEWKKK